MQPASTDPRVAVTALGTLLRSPSLPSYGRTRLLRSNRCRGDTQWLLTLFASFAQWPRSSRQQVRRAGTLETCVEDWKRATITERDSCPQVSSIARPVVQRCIRLAVPSETYWRQVVTKYTIAQGQVSSLPPGQNSQNADM